METLNANAVEELFGDCMRSEAEPEDPQPVIVEGVIVKAHFVQEKLNANGEKITSMLMELPENFLRSKGGGWSFLNAAMTKDGEHWGEHRHVDFLMCLGLAIGKVELLFPPELWHLCPGGMPYFIIND